MTDQLLVPRELLSIIRERLAVLPQENWWVHTAIDELLAQPADCEPKPVAIVCGSRVQWLPGADSLKDHTELFAHPAPAGVVLPERKPVKVGEDGRHLSYCEQLENRKWNACREETARLNGVQP